MATTIRPPVSQGEASLLSVVSTHRRYSVHHPNFQHAVSVQDLTSYLWSFIQHSKVTGGRKSQTSLRPDSTARPTCQPSERERPTTALRLLAEARQTIFSELRQLGRDTTVMDVILDHPPLVYVTDLPADGRRLSRVPRNYAPTCQAGIGHSRKRGVNL